MSLYVPQEIDTETLTTEGVRPLNTHYKRQYTGSPYHIKLTSL